MYVCMCVYIHVYTYICMHTYTHIYIFKIIFSTLAFKRI